MRVFGVLVLLSMILVAACGEDEGVSSAADESSVESSVSNKAVEVGQAALAGDWNTVYASLHPNQQAAVNHDQFVQCRSALSFPPSTVTVSQTGHDAQVAPQIFDDDAWAVTLQIAAEGYETITDIVHLYSGDDDTISWYLNQSSIDAFVAGGCDVDPQSAKDFAQQLADAEIAGDWETVYNGLHPSQKAVVPHDLFLECRASDTVRATAAEVTGVTTETISVPEVPDTESYAVTLSLTIPDQEPELVTLHIYEVEGGFAWVLGDESIAAFQAGQCD